MIVKQNESVVERREIVGDDTDDDGECGDSPEPDRGQVSPTRRDSSVSVSHARPFNTSEVSVYIVYLVLFFCF